MQPFSKVNRTRRLLILKNINVTNSFAKKKVKKSTTPLRVKETKRADLSLQKSIIHILHSCAVKTTRLAFISEINQ